MKVFFDLEFTGLHQHTTPISIGLISASRRTFYAEFEDYALEQVDKWIEENVIANLQIPSIGRYPHVKVIDASPHGEHYSIETFGDKDKVASELKRWLSQFDVIEMWGDCLAYDWVLFCELFGGGAECLPRNVFYIPFDICTVFKLKGVDPDISRQEFVGAGHPKHNSLWDAMTIKACYEGLMSE